MTARPIFVNFSLHTDGDLDFKKELIGLMIENVLELQQSLRLSLKLNDSAIYRTACHKVNSTLSILDDREFSDTVTVIKADVNNHEKVNIFNRICTEVINSLRQIS